MGNRLVAEPCPLAVCRGAVAVCACAFALAEGVLWFPVRIEELGGSFVRICGGFMDRCGM